MKKIIILLAGVFLFGLIFWAISPDTFVSSSPARPSVSVRSGLGSEISISELNNNNDSGREKNIQKKTSSTTSKPVVKLTTSKKTTKNTAIATKTTTTVVQPSSRVLGNFTSPDSSYQSRGQVSLVNKSGKQSLRFDNFSVSNGPDLFVTLNKKSNPNSGSLGTHIKLGRLQKISGSQEYDLSGIDLSQYESVAVYCDRFSKVFAAAKI